MVIRALTRLRTVSSSLSPFTRGVNSLAVFRTDETNPTKFTKSHLGRFFKVDQETFDIIHADNALPVEFKKNCTTFQENCILIRKPFIDVASCIESYDLQKPAIRFILYGQLGCGKTMTMGCLLQYAYVKEFILVHVPWAKFWTRYQKEALPSVIREGYYDHTINSVIWLSHFKKQNFPLLEKLDLKITKDYVWNKRESTLKGSNILDIVDHGISRPIHAAECIFSLISELKVLSTEGRCKTFVGVDGVNAFYHPCYTIRRPDKSWVPPNFITVFEAFKQLFTSDWMGGVVVCTVDKTAVPTDIRISDLPRELLTKQGWEHFDPFLPVHVDKYSSTEVQTTLDYFLDRKWLQHPKAGSEEGRLELEYLSTRNPSTLTELCNSR